MRRALATIRYVAILLHGSSPSRVACVAVHAALTPIIALGVALGACVRRSECITRPICADQAADQYDQPQADVDGQKTTLFGRSRTGSLGSPWRGRRRPTERPREDVEIEEPIERENGGVVMCVLAWVSEDFRLSIDVNKVSVSPATSPDTDAVRFRLLRFQEQLTLVQT